MEIRCHFEFWREFSRGSVDTMYKKKKKKEWKNF